MLIVALRGRDLGGSRYRPESAIDLPDDEPVTYVLSAMCADFDKDNPSESSTFSLTEPDDPVLACVARRAVDLDSVQAVQAAVWQRTDEISYETMRDRFDISPDEWARGEVLLQSCVAAR
jgi:hypothetical protein